MEHLGTRELLPQPDPDGAGQRLEFTGQGEPFLFAAGDSEVLRETAVNVTKGRNLDRTAVLQGLALPDPNRVPPICSMGGLGTFTQGHLVPTLAMISGPWSLYAPSFRRSAIDFKRMRSQLLAVGDTVLALDEVPREEIAGDYPSYREQRAQGAADLPAAGEPPAVRPGPWRVRVGDRTERAVAVARGGLSGDRGRAAPAAGARRSPSPSQPKSGPGGSDYAHDGVRVSSGGTGADAWYSFEPIKPRPAKAPVAIVMHGYYEFSGYASMAALIRHTVRKGTTVIYPRWQTGVATRAPGRS